MNNRDMTDDITANNPMNAELSAEEIFAQVFGPDVPDSLTPMESSTTTEATIADDDDEPFTVSLDILPPEHGRSLLMPNSHSLSGRAVWQSIDTRNLDHKLRRALRAGLARQTITQLPNTPNCGRDQIRRRMTTCASTNVRLSFHKFCFSV